MFNVASPTNYMSAGACVSLFQIRVRKFACFVVFFVSQFQGRLSPFRDGPPLTYSSCRMGAPARGSRGRPLARLPLRLHTYVAGMARFVCTAIGIYRPRR